ncbi:redoxin domain-containing protein [Ferrovibrio terrae]|uniref:Redoxin domain-containing protein n=1 Tax=Ferrovibrio terrae TaxID=2594003 RepID=A0A516H6F5_9PROT|nr:cytochrome c biogenesis protein CcdA [Ferrovibrio terrae]QDO99349.1 redoxin domain-containing protein [Ferrovibrio terrae]
MTLFALAYLAGLFTIVTPCILPVLPFVLARADQPFRQGALPLLLGLAVAFAAAASLGAVAGHWAVAASHYGRNIALAGMALFGLAMLVPAVATRLMAPLVSAGNRLLHRVEMYRSAQRDGGKTSSGASLLVGIATGLVWAPCAGPVLGVILTGAALRGPGAETSLLLFTYGLGAATALALGLLFGRRLAAGFSSAWTDRLRRVSGAAVIAGVAAIWSGLDVGLLTRLSSAGTAQIEQCLLTLLGNARAAEAQPKPQPLTGPLAALLQPRPWLNGPALRAEDLRGKVVLVNFWTYSCINCLRLLPHVRGWAEKYRDSGLVVVGVHTPEFAFEKRIENVARALPSLGITYPVALDNDFTTWRAFGNQAWPALYFIGSDGQIRQRILGEGSEDRGEKLIQQLLAETRGAAMTMPLGTVAGNGAQAAPDLRNLASGETYIGYQQTSGFASPGGLHPDTAQLYQAPAALSRNRWGLDGSWTVGAEFATLHSAGGGILHRFRARDLHLVLAPTSDANGGSRPVRFRVTLDGAAPGADHGADIDAEGWGVVQDSRLYQLVRQSGTVGERTFRIEFDDPGIRAYAFTFG